MNNPWARKYFRKFLQIEHSEENLEFWSEIEQFKELPSNTEISVIQSKAKYIYDCYLGSTAKVPVNLSGRLLSQLSDLIGNSHKILH